MGRNSYFQKNVLITGGSSGIGLALAKEFARLGAHLILLARDPNKLEKARIEIEALTSSSSEVITLIADIRSPEQVTKQINLAAAEAGGLDILINCAGTTSCGRFSDQSIEDLRNGMETNYLGAVYASKAAWPWLKESKGQLSFISSVAGYMGLIGYSGYAPGKFAMVGLAECLRMEGKRDHIRVSIIYPPDTDTPMLQYERKYALPESQALSKSIKVLSADKVARLYIRGLEKNKFEIYCDFNSKFVRWMKNNFPGITRTITDRISRRARVQSL